MFNDANVNKIKQSLIYEIKNKLTLRHQIRLWIKRDDLLHPHVSGNKWRKMKYNLIDAQQKKTKTLLTFGGAFSNHIAATAAAGQLNNISTIGIIRGEQILPLNPTLAYAKACGMHFYFVDRSTYRQKEKSDLIHKLIKQYDNTFILPEGGTNHLAIKGSEEIIKELVSQIPNFPTHITSAVGTGGTISGMITGLHQLKPDNGTRIIGFSALKGNFLQGEVEALLKNYSAQVYTNWQIQNDYHFGGYAKFKPELIQFINKFKAEHAIPLDPIYTGKMMFGIFDMIQKGEFPAGSRIVAIHTGGLQGIAGFNQRFGDILI